MKVNMKTIAQKANVSLSTVSRVLNNPSSVDKKKVELVNYWIKKLDYQPNLGAQTLKSKNTFLIGVSIPNLENPYFVKIIEILEEITSKNGYNIILHNTKENKLKEKENIENFIKRRVDGIILVAIDIENINYLKRKNIPHISLTNELNETNRISACHKTGGKLVAKHFIETGCNSINFIGIEEDPKFLGMKEYLYENGLEDRNKNNIFLPCGVYSSFEIRNYIKEFLSKFGIKNDAFFAGNDIIAYELIKELEERNIKIPEEVSVVGFDNTFLAKIFKISSVNQPIEKITQLGFEILLKQIEKNSYEKIGNFKINPNLIVRESSKK